jgi:hypothetical protein
VEGRGWIADQTVTLEVPPRSAVEKKLTFGLGEKIPPGRHVFPLRVAGAGLPDGGDAFLVVDVDS